MHPSAYFAQADGQRARALEGPDRPSGGPAWDWEPRRFQYYLHNFMTCQPDLNFHDGEVQDWALGTLRFWLDRGVDGFRFDTVDFYAHDRLLRDAADPRPKARPAFKPYDMQYHLSSKNQPENLPFLGRIRRLMALDAAWTGGRLRLGPNGALVARHEPPTGPAASPVASLAG